MPDIEESRVTEPHIVENPYWLVSENYTAERVVAIAYPRDSYFIIDELGPDGSWLPVMTKGDNPKPVAQDTMERALAQAQSRANVTGQPHRVREWLDS